jgi:hypothetical protein
LQRHLLRIAATGERGEGVMARAKVTTNHREIRGWVEARGGSPAHVKGSGDDRDAGILRIDFPGSSEVDVEAIDWERWFAAFDQSELAFLYQDETTEGKPSRFNKIVSRDSAAAEVH